MTKHKTHVSPFFKRAKKEEQNQTYIMNGVGAKVFTDTKIICMRICIQSIYSTCTYIACSALDIIRVSSVAYIVAL